MQIRRVAADETLVAADLYLASRAGAGSSIPPPVHDDDDTRRWMRDDFMPNAELWFAVDEDDAPLAILALEGDDWLEQLYVLPQRRAAEIGRPSSSTRNCSVPPDCSSGPSPRTLRARAFYESQRIRRRRVHRRRRQRGARARRALRVDAMSTSPPTLYDVAREAGVSLATASRTLNGSTRRVNEEYRVKVLAAAAKLGLSPRTCRRRRWRAARHPRSRCSCATSPTRTSPRSPPA